MYIEIIILLNLIFFYRTLRYELVSDDMDGFKEKGNWYRRIVHGNAGNNVQVEHLLTLLNHTVNCILIYISFGSTQISFIAACLFSINPANSQASVWISGKIYSRYLTIVLLANCIGLAIPAILVIWYKKIRLCRVAGRCEMTPINAEVSIRKLAVPIKLYGYYFLFCLFPLRLGMYHKLMENFGLDEVENNKGFALDKHFWIGASVIIASVLIIAYDAWGLRVALGWYMLAILPFLNYPKIVSQMVAERDVYIANVGLMIGLASVCSSHIVVCFFTFYFVRFLMHIRAYKTNSMFLEYNFHDNNFKDSVMCAVIKGRTEQISGNWTMALQTYMQGLRGRACDNRLNFFVSEILYTIGKHKEAIFHLEIAEKNPIPTKGDITPVVRVLKQKCHEMLQGELCTSARR